MANNMDFVEGWKVWGPNEVKLWKNNAAPRVDRALEFCKNRKLALDVGANCGLYTEYLSRYFEVVEAFEPFPQNFEALQYNRDMHFKYDRVVYLNRFGLSDKAERVGFNDDNGGISAYSTGKPGDIQFWTLDSLNRAPDLIKIDAEGYDLKVLKGGIKTIKRCQPVILIEDKPVYQDRNPEWYKVGEIRAFLEGLGYTQKGQFDVDYVYAVV